MPEQPGFPPREQPQGRPTDEDLKERVERFRKIKEAGFPHQVEEILWELEDMAAGKGKNPEDGELYNIRQRYYPGWEDEDFEKLVKMTREELGL